MSSGTHKGDEGYPLWVPDPGRSPGFEGMGFLERLELLYSFWEPGLDVDTLGYTLEEFKEASQRLTLLAENVTPQ